MDSRQIFVIGLTTIIMLSVGQKAAQNSASPNPGIGPIMPAYQIGDSGLATSAATDIYKSILEANKIDLPPSESGAYCRSFRKKNLRFRGNNYPILILCGMNHYRYINLELVCPSNEGCTMVTREEMQELVGNNSHMKERLKERR